MIFLSLADNPLEEVPEHLWKVMPNVKTLDLGRTKIRRLSSSNFKGFSPQCLVLAGNVISEMDRDTFPVKVQR